MTDTLPEQMEPARYRFPIEWGKCREFALALLDPDPVSPEIGHFEQAFLPMPPTMLVCAHRYSPEGMPAILKLARDGYVDRGRVLQGEIEFEFNRPLVAGEELIVSEAISDVHEKVTQKARLRFVVIEASFRTPEGTLVCTTRTTNIERKPLIDDSVEPL